MLPVEAATAGREWGAGPHLRGLRALAGRARLPLPPEVEAALAADDADERAGGPTNGHVTNGHDSNGHAIAEPAAAPYPAGASAVPRRRLRAPGDLHPNTFALSRREPAGPGLSAQVRSHC